MSFTKNPGRFAGLLYVLFSIPGVFAMVYVPNKLIVHGNAAATANSIAASARFFASASRPNSSARPVLSSWLWLYMTSSRRSTGGTPHSW